MKYGLALHTSSPALGLAISNSLENIRCLGRFPDRQSQQVGLRYQAWDLGRETSNLLHPYLRDFIRPQTWSDLGWIAVANGPGGFMGTRLGVVTARTLGQQLNLPVFTISSLAAIAWQLTHHGTIAISMSAQRDEVFGAIYHVSQDERELTVIRSDAVMSAAEWDSRLAELRPSHHHYVPQSTNLADSVVGVLALAKMADDRGERPHWGMALPFYGQHPVVNSAIGK